MKQLVTILIAFLIVATSCNNDDGRAKKDRKIQDLESRLQKQEKIIKKQGEALSKKSKVNVPDGKENSSQKPKQREEEVSNFELTPLKPSNYMESDDDPCAYYFIYKNNEPIILINDSEGGYINVLKINDREFTDLSWEQKENGSFHIWNAQMNITISCSKNENSFKCSDLTLTYKGQRKVYYNIEIKPGC